MASIHGVTASGWIIGGAGWFWVWFVECIDAVIWAMWQRQASSGGRAAADHRSITITEPGTKSGYFISSQISRTCCRWQNQRHCAIFFLLASVDDHSQLREFLMQSSAAAHARRRLRQWCLLAFALLLAACSSAPKPVATPTNSAEAQFRSAPPPPPFVHPLPGARVSSMFAKHIVKSRNRKHHGVDFAAPQGTPVYAASSGVVLNADMGSLSDAFGKVVLIEHGDKLQSLSAHLSRIDVQIGDFVQAGQQIGLVGKTGRATGPHLHFELWRNGHPQDPLRYLPNGAATPQRTSP
jgi:hypothetical protein